MCVFPAMVFFIARGELDRLPLWALFLLGLLFISGLWAVAMSLFKLDENGALASMASAVMALGFAGLAFLVAWREKDGWSGGIPFIPQAWNQAIPRLLFALGGLIATFCGISLLRRASRQRRKE